MIIARQDQSVYRIHKLRYISKSNPDKLTTVKFVAKIYRFGKTKNCYLKPFSKVNNQY